ELRSASVAPILEKVSLEMLAERSSTSTPPALGATSGALSSFGWRAVAAKARTSPARTAPRAMRRTVVCAARRANERAPVYGTALTEDRSRPSRRHRPPGARFQATAASRTRRRRSRHLRASTLRRRRASATAERAPYAGRRGSAAVRTRESFEVPSRAESAAGVCAGDRRGEPSRRPERLPRGAPERRRRP